MKILFINPILYTADNNKIPEVQSIRDTMAYNFAMGFAKNGMDVTLYAANAYRPQKQESYAIEVIFDDVKCPRIFQPSVLPFLANLRKYLKQNQKAFDLIISSEVFSIASLTLCCMVPAKKIILWHELALHPRKFHKIPSKIWYNVIAKIFERKALVIPRSENALRFVSQYMPRVCNHWIEHGINLEHFVYKKEKKEQFIVVAQLIARKNIASIIDKFAKFKQKYGTAYKLIIVGRGELENALRGQIDRLSLANEVNLAGFKTHSELNVLLADSRAMLVDTLQDDNMVSIPESIACGTPVLSNLVPTTFIAKLGVGVQKEWNEDDLYQMMKNDAMVERCENVREKISNVFLAKEMIRLWRETLN